MVGEQKMDYKFDSSLKRAIALLNTPGDSKNYFILKFCLEPFACHHLNHWPNTWEQINEYIYPSAPIKDEGDALIKKNGAKFVLESHESGPEIVAYIALATASATLLKSIIDLATTIIKGFSSERGKQTSRIKISKRQIVNGKLEENTIEIDIPLSKETEKRLEGKIRKLISKKI
jgi:hypothetical protein